MEEEAGGGEESAARGGPAVEGRVGRESSSLVPSLGPSGPPGSLGPGGRSRTHPPACMLPVPNESNG